MRAYSRLFGMMVVATSVAACGGGSQETTQGTAGNTGTSTETGSGGAGTTTTEGGGGSAGSVAACSEKMGATGATNIKLDFDGVERNADVHVPLNYDPTVPTTLVLNFHGYTSNASQEAILTKMSEAADARGFIVVYPNGLDQSWNAGKCCGVSAQNEVNDVGFVGALIDKLEEEWCIDPKRVFATGMSNGGFLSNRLGCEMSDRIAAIAPVAGVIGIPLENCNPPRKVPVMHFHGTSDTLVPYDGGGAYMFPSVNESVGRWRAVDGCTDTLDISYEKGDSQCLSAQGCGDGSEVILCTVTDGGHTWPGGFPVPGLGKTTMDLDATNSMLDFFEKHSLP